ncbi:MAG: SRPBCC family protein [Thermoleophilaceae bacterium]
MGSQSVPAGACENEGIASSVHDQRYLDCSRARLWELIGDPERYPEWWPSVVEVNGESYDAGEEFVQVTRGPMGKMETRYLIDERDEPAEIRMTCQTSGTFAHWRLTDAQGGTFVDFEGGMEPKSMLFRLFDETAGRIYFRRWADQSIQALTEAAAKSPEPPGPVDDARPDPAEAAGPMPQDSPAEPR